MTTVIIQIGHNTGISTTRRKCFIFPNFESFDLAKEWLEKFLPYLHQVLMRSEKNIWLVRPPVYTEKQVSYTERVNIFPSNNFPCLIEEIAKHF